MASLDGYVHIEEQNIYTMSAEGEVMLTLLASFAQAESLSCSDNCKWRIRKGFEEGRASTCTMLGYRLVDGEITLVEEEAETAKRIFDLYLVGYGLQKIANTLNEEGLYSIFGNEWHPTTVRKVLTNEKYCGDLLLQKVYRENHLTKRKCYNTGELPQYFVEDDHPAVVTRQIFMAVQDELKRRAKEKTQPVGSKSSFTGKIRCSCCGKNYRRKTTPYKSVSRFARNTVDSLVTIRQLKEKGVEVFFEKENIYTLDAKGELLLTIMSSLAQEEARSISENTSWGRRKSFADGKVSLGYSNFLGYDKGPDGELVINEEQAKIVRRIYAEFLAGKTPGGIAKGLTADGIETPGHKKVWQASTVLNILKNEKYYGAAILQKEITVSYLTKEKRPNTGELPMYYIEKDHEPIVSPETYQMVQEEMRRRKEAGSNMQCVSIFSSRIICGDCGGYYGRKIWHSSTKYTAWHWHCNAKFQKRKYCETPTLKERYCKPPKERPMLCTDIRISIDLPQKAFCRAWNLIVAKKLRYQATLRSTVDNAEDILVRYRAEEMCLLIDEIGKINEFSYPLMLKTLNRVVVNANGKLTFIFQSGIKITV